MKSFLFRNAVHVLRERERIDAVNHLKQRQRVPDLIFLEMTNEMPSQIRRQLRNFYSRFLNTTFAKYTLSRLDRFSHPLGIVRLGDRDQFDRTRRATSFCRGPRDLFVHTREIFGNQVHRPI